MQSIFAVLAFVAVASAQFIAPASYISRAPAHDSAVIKSDRLGGNFAYSVAESHAYSAHTPIVQHVTSPVAVSYSAPAIQYASAPVQAVHYAAAPAVQYASAPAYGYSYGAGYPYASAYNGVYGYGSPVLGSQILLKK